jgi:hypothetical protein
MQTTNPNQAGHPDAPAHGGGFGNIKSFTDLKGKLIEKEIDAFAEQVRKGIGCWREAGHILVELSKRQPDIFRLIQARHPEISESTLQTFARIGRKEIWPPLLVDSSMGARKLLECNYDVQKEYAEKPIKVAIAWNGNEIKTCERKVQDLSRAECFIVFDGQGGVNTIDQQAWRLRPEKSRPGAAKVIDASAKEAPAYAPSRMVNVDIGYFSLVVDRDGKITCEPCGKSALAQPVRVIDAGNGLKSAIVLYYKQEKR